MIKKFFNELAERLYPGELYCLCCGKAIDWSRPYSMCDSCREAIKWTRGRLCRRCGKMLSPNNTEDLCYNCRANEHIFDHGYSCSEYDAHDRSLVYSLKYDEKPEIARIIGAVMADRMLSEFTKEELIGKYNLLVPIPISDERRSIRGYNQAALIAEYFAEKTGLPYYGEVLKRQRETSAMKGLTPAERKLNLVGSFALLERARDRVEDSSCLIIDDIVTTGATVDAAASVLKANGANNVDFASFASGADVIKS